MENVYDKKAQGSQIRLRAKWVSDSEKNIFSVKKKSYKHKIVSNVLRENNLLTEDNDILSAMCDYYESLYS